MSEETGLLTQFLTYISRLQISLKDINPLSIDHVDLGPQTVRIYTCSNLYRPGLPRISPPYTVLKLQVSNRICPVCFMLTS